ncbi:peptidoglycan recognition protein family protein, partial [Aromatoleum evansii]|uniref:peptidoglycan recognition protein family protein n=1 Tax=Aromatoleum evansii TaxID=59406 RepID=UPI001B7CEB53
SKTYRQVNKDSSIGVEFAGNYPDVTKGPTDAQIAAWRVLVKVLRARYGIPLERVYAHNWIDFKDARYCEGCALATMARSGASRGRLRQVCGACVRGWSVLRIPPPRTRASPLNASRAQSRAFPGRRFCGAFRRYVVR